MDNHFLGIGFGFLLHEPSRRLLLSEMHSINPNILVPNLGMLVDETRQQLHTLARPQIYHLNPVLPQPVDPTAKGLALADNHPSKAELTDQPRAVPTRRERRHHGHLAIAALPSRTPERVGLAMRAWIALLHPPVAPGTQKPPVRIEDRRPDGNPALGESRPRLRQRA